MQCNDVRKQIEEINALVLALSSQWEWFDFQFSLIQEGSVKLEGSFDLTALYKKYDKIEIEFSDPVFIKTILYGWGLQKGKPFIELDEQDECLKELNITDEIHKNKYYSFKINTDRNEPVLIIAKSIQYSVIKKE